jgi:hypothetical protein
VLHLVSHGKPGVPATAAALATPMARATGPYPTAQPIHATASCELSRYSAVAQDAETIAADCGPLKPEF